MPNSRAEEMILESALGTEVIKSLNAKLVFLFKRIRILIAAQFLLLIATILVIAYYFSRPSPASQEMMRETKKLIRELAVREENFNRQRAIFYGIVEASDSVDYIKKKNYGDSVNSSKRP